MKYILGSVALGLLLIVAAVTYSPAPAHITKLTGQEFVSTYEQTNEATLIDVRTPQEFAAGHLAGAININFQDPSFQTQINALPKDKPYFLYCHSGNRSGKAIAYMSSAGFASVSELTGGIAGNPQLSLTREQ